MRHIETYTIMKQAPLAKKQWQKNNEVVIVSMGGGV